MLVANRFNTVLSQTKSEAFSLHRMQTSIYFKFLLSIMNSIFHTKTYEKLTKLLLDIHFTVYISYYTFVKSQHCCGQRLNET